MVELGERYGFGVQVIEDVAADPALEPGDDDALAAPLRRRWSSTWVREALTAGDVRQAARVLGRPHRMRGEVVHGDARGRELGFPTANLSPTATGMVPADGVYAGWLRRTARTAGDPDAVLPAAISVGTNPTFEGSSRRVEAYVLDRTDLDLYGEQVVLEFVELLRPTLRFDSVAALIERMHTDVAGVREVLAGAAAAPGPAAG
jgi:riboflavin kinase/FMN adenylyltransferase